MRDLLEAAAEYLNAGLPIIALAGKQPNTEKHKRGLTEPISGSVDGDEDLGILREYFEHPDTTGIGLVIPEHLVVVDIDGEEGARQWRDLVGPDAVTPDTAVAKTGRGLHLWFWTPRIQGSAKLGPKLDLKGRGGYVAAPPSRHPDGHIYEWLDPLVIDGRIMVDALPDPIERKLAVADQIRDEFHVERPVYTLYQLTLEGRKFRLHTESCPPPIDGLVKFLAESVEGNRNNALAWAALQARDEGVTLEVAMRDLGGAAQAAGLSAQEVRTTIRSAYRRSARK